MTERLGLIAALLGVIVLHGARAAPADAVRDLAPTGALRVAINVGNPVLAQKDPGSGELDGVSVALARELGRQLGVPVTMTTFPGAGQVTAAIPGGTLDVVFLAIDPKRGEELDFTPPYVLIEGTYMVARDSPLTRLAAFDQPGLRIAVAQGSTYDLFLTRTLKHAVLVRAPTSVDAAALFRGGGADAVAGVRQSLQAIAAADPAMRVIPGRFMAIEQAMATPHGRAAGAAFLRGFIEQEKADGFVAKALARSGQTEAEVAPAAP